ncbi:MAG TPA: DUF6194 family protein [Chloroflexaceae bacterium]|nr:DUF6194 family protein [Chloroflexaceae bacterium]
MDEQTVTRYILDTFPDVETTDAFGYTFFFYRDDHMLPFATIAAADNEHDRVSNLDRPGVFRVNIGFSKQTFQTLFGAEGRRVEDYDFTALDTLMPHPEYAAQSFICVLNPGDATVQQVRSLLAEAHERAVQRYQRRHQRPAEYGDDEGAVPDE